MNSRKVEESAFLLFVGRKRFLFLRKNAESRKFCNIFEIRMLTCQRIGGMLVYVEESALFLIEKGKRRAALHRNDIKISNFTKKRKEARFFWENSGKLYATVIT